jgi:lipopolysaccharide export system permease protein
MWLLNLVLLLLALPSILTREPGKLKAGILQCAVLVGACMGIVFVTQQLAGTPPPGPQWLDKWPAILAWTPIIIFLPIAVWLLDRVKT